MGQDAAGYNGSGNSWENAIPELADALKWAREQYDTDHTVFDAEPLKIYVAKGTYLPKYKLAETDNSDAPTTERDKMEIRERMVCVEVLGTFTDEAIHQ